MSEEKTKIELSVRLILRMFACIAIGLGATLAFVLIFFIFSITFLPGLSGTNFICTLIFINLAFFAGSCIGGYLSLSVKRSIVPSAVIAGLLGGVFIFTMGVLYGIINIVCIVAGGLFGGYLATSPIETS